MIHTTLSHFAPLRALILLLYKFSILTPSAILAENKKNCKQDISAFLSKINNILP